MRKTVLEGEIMEKQSLTTTKAVTNYEYFKPWLQTLGFALAATSSLCLVAVLVLSYVVGINIFA